MEISKISGLQTALDGKEATANKVTTIGSTSTDTQYPSAKAVYTELAKKQNSLTIDSALSSTSTNPVQNKVVNTALAGKVTANSAITGATKTKITYDSKGLVTGGADLTASDIPALEISKISGLQTALDNKQATLAAGDNVTILDNTVSVPTLTDTATAETAGNAGKPTSWTLVKEYVASSGNNLAAEIALKQDASTAVEVSKAGTAAGTSTKPVYVTSGGVATVVSSIDASLLPKASTSEFGAVKTSTNITNSGGVISVATGSPSQLGVVKVGQIPSGSATSTTYATIWVE